MRWDFKFAQAIILLTIHIHFYKIYKLRVVRVRIPFVVKKDKKEPKDKI